ncbi:hypothetical protein BRD11_01030 [Halobacteriales archaeon SW_12_69_24]|jgi:hypothetical protein|nr:MAG: hypothetical protein BRD11_01030 [Halobacteriales archaeon SW_12_69_24]
MSQATLDDDDLFDEAATEMRADVESSLEAARDALPSAAAIWDTEADNTLGVLNGLKGALDTGDAADHLRDAKKWYAVGTEADAFEDAGDLEAEVDELQRIIADVEAAHEQVSDLTATVPELRGALEDAHEAAEE